MTDGIPVLVERLRAEELSRDQHEAIWRCYHRYADCQRHRFVNTLSSADEVFLICRRSDHRVLGFLANRILLRDANDGGAVVLYTLYAALDPRLRGNNILQKLGFKSCVRLKLRFPLRPLYLMFTASTFKSYLWMPCNFVDYWPHRQRAMPAFARKLMDSVLQENGVGDWVPSAGVLKRHGTQRYREGVVVDDPAVLADLDIRYYADRNPGQHLGDSLACLCPISARNVVSTLVRLFRRMRRTKQLHAARRSAPQARAPTAAMGQSNG